MLPVLCYQIYIVMRDIVKLITLTAFLSFTTSAEAQYANLDQGLLDTLSKAEEDAVLPVLIQLEDRVDLTALKRNMDALATPAGERPRVVIEALLHKAETTQGPVIDFLRQEGADPAALNTMWVGNAIALHADAQLIESLASHPAIGEIWLNAPVTDKVGPVSRTAGSSKAVGSREPGHNAIGAPEMWAMGYTGHGRKAIVYDTGIWPTHPSLHDRFLANHIPLAQSWFPNFSPTPQDMTSSHGTHVSGTILGLDTATADTIGVAFGAQLIAADGIGNSSLGNITQLVQWILNPDGNITTSSDVPDVMNNSWNSGSASPNNPPCSAFQQDLLNTLEAAGIATVFSAGNAGPDSSTITLPKNINTGLVNTFTVGALNGNASGPEYNIANFSSRGPSFCEAEGSLLIKPEVSAPGVSVRSAVGHDGYDFFSGTSMAAPHVSGAVLLLKEAFPYLTGEEILLALYHTAVDQGEPGEDNTFGMGIIHVKHAFDYLAEVHTPVPPDTLVTDIEVVEIIEPRAPYLCGSAALQGLRPVIRIRNNGVETVQGFTFQYSINQLSFMTDFFPNLVLDPGAEAVLELDEIDYPFVDFAELQVVVNALPDDFNPFNNSAVSRWQPLPDHEGLLIAENFDNGAADNLWLVYNPDGMITWDTAHVVQSDGTVGPAAWMNFAEYNPINSQRDDLISAVLSGVEPGSAYTLSFDYFYHKRSNNTVQFDTLAVTAVVGCGEAANEIELMRAAGDSLWTVDFNKANAFPENPEEWMHVDLPFFAESADPEAGDENLPMYIRFEAINRRGNHLLVDNINLSTPTRATASLERPELTLRPNPASQEVTLEWSHHSPFGQVTIYDLRGQKVLQAGALGNQSSLSIGPLPPGLYVVEVLLDAGLPAVRKLVVQ